MKPKLTTYPDEPRYIQRNSAGKVIGHYANPHPYAQEAVAYDHPEILEWDAKRRDRKGPYSIHQLMERIAVLEANLETLKGK